MMGCSGLVQVEGGGLLVVQSKRLGVGGGGGGGGGRSSKRVVVKAAGAGELSPDSTTYLVAGAALVALVGTAFPILFSRKDTCPECDGAGFVRQAGGVLRANAARKDLPQIVCKTCNGLGKLGQIDK